MSLLTETEVAGVVGLEVTEAFAPEAAAAGKKLVEEALAGIFHKPLPLAEALPRLAEVLPKGTGEVADYLPTITKRVMQDGRLTALKVSRMLGSGAEELVLATDSNQALKLGVGSLPRPVPNLAFDAPVLEHGKLGTGVHYYTQPIGETAGVTDKHVLSVIKKIRSAGFIEEDIWNVEGPRHNQVALFGSARKPLLIDQGSALSPYGQVFKDGQLVPHAGQQHNLTEIKEFLDMRRIELLKQSAARPLNPLHMGENSLSAQMPDWQLHDEVHDYLKMTNCSPQLKLNWSNFEISHALKTLALTK